MKVLVLGAFGYTNNQLDGQTIKTRNVYQLLKDKYDGSVRFTDTLKLKKSLKEYVVFVQQLLWCDKLILIPAESGLSILLPLVYYLSFILKYSVICICIGGWQIDFFNGKYNGKTHYKSMRICKRVKAFLPEMTSINNSLINNYDFKNTEVFPNFRKFKKDLFSKNCSDGLRLVFLARIQKKKGYPIIMRCADYFRKNDLKVTIDFYGQVSDDERRDFISGISNNSDFFRYYGELKLEDIQKTLCEYDALILPTQYYTEGFPGSVLDAFIAGIPVIVTEWKHSHEFVEDGKTGFIIPFNDNYESLLEKIMILYNNRDTLTGMKENAKEEREKYSIETAWNVLSKYIGSGK